MDRSQVLDPEKLPLITTEELSEIVQHIVIRMNRRVIIHGRSGYGKTQVVEQACELADAVYCPILLSQYETVDLRGGMDVDKATNSTVWYPPSTMPFVGNDRFPDDKPIVIFFDEASHATLPVLSIAYQMMTDGRIGEHVFKPNVYLMMATNLADDGGITGGRWPRPLDNRLTHYKLVISAEAYVAYIQKVRPSPIWQAYFQMRPERISTYDPKNAAERAFGSPRSWFTAMDYYNDGQLTDNLKRKSIAGVVGKANAEDFWAFEVNRHSLIPLRKILANPTGVELPDEESLLWITAMSVSGSITLKNVATLDKFIGRLSVEYQMMIWTLAMRRDPSLLTCDEFIRFSKLQRDVFSTLAVA